MKTVYVKKYIKSVDDLPKDGLYPCHVKSFDANSISSFILLRDETNFDVYWWLDNIDWYLLPVELPDEKEIEDEANEYSCEYEVNAKMAAFFGYKRGANYIINKLIKP